MMGGAGQAAGSCRQALVLALDVSSSVDTVEYGLQIKGLAATLLDPEVQALLLSEPANPIALTIFEWSGRFDQRSVIGWTIIQSPADLLAISGVLMQHERPEMSRPTAIGPALAHAGRLLQTGPDCRKRTIDISGDGKHNDGDRPVLGRTAAIFATTTVNALVIGHDAPPGLRSIDGEIADLSAYFRAEVIHGPGAFIETAFGFQDFQAAMKRKLLRELAMVLAIGPNEIAGPMANGPDPNAPRWGKTTAARQP
ncbi:MAG: DUF1194 domain-containing protein [Rhodobacteraceae bacterium]|nr:DUF1194 domain-containing protein [Paracoccaceae bacterium]